MFKWFLLIGFLVVLYCLLAVFFARRVARTLLHIYRLDQMY